MTLQTVLILLALAALTFAKPSRREQLSEGYNSYFSSEENYNSHNPLENYNSHNPLENYNSHNPLENHNSYNPLENYNSYNSLESYETGYQVQKQSEELDFGHTERRSGGVVHGYYYVLLPNRLLQKVTYYVDRHSGFVADVTFEQLSGYSHEEEDNLYRGR